MKTIKGAFLAVAILTLAAPKGVAIEGLKIAVRCPDVLLSWPSATGETYIVQYRPDMVPSTQWTLLTNSLPAASGTNTTYFVHAGAAPCPPIPPPGPLNTNRPPAPGAMTATTTSTAPATTTTISPSTATFLASRHIYPPYQWDIEHRPPHPWELEDRPPLPWEPGAIFLGPSQPVPPQDPGFYEVVRVGIHLFGFTNGMVLRGQVRLLMEYGNTDTNGTLNWLFLGDTNTDNVFQGVSLPALPLGPTNAFVGVWDTMQATNGTYTIQLSATLNDDTYYVDNPATITVSNLVWFTDPWFVGGDAIFFGVQTIYRDGTGTWHADIFNDQNVRVGSAIGPIDTNGFMTYPGRTGPFSFNNTDASGNRNPSTYYTFSISTDIAHPILPFPPFPNLTNVTTIESNWNFLPTWSTIVYEDVFGNGNPLGQNDVLTMMQMICAAESVYHPMELHNPLDPYQIGLHGTWIGDVLPNGIMSYYCRDFIWFGHGSEKSIGSGPPLQTSLPSGAVALVLTNASSPLKGPNLHPYRFVFLNGCNTTKGDWPQAFGIPKKKNMTSADFVNKRGIRPRAFLGWDKLKVYRYVNAGLLEYNFEQWNDQFWASWNQQDRNGNFVFKLQDAANRVFNNPDGTSNTGRSGAVVYGAADLPIDR